MEISIVRTAVLFACLTCVSAQQYGAGLWGNHQTATVIAILPAILPAGRISTDYAIAFTADGGDAPYRWSLVSGRLPPGLLLNFEDGSLSGQPTVTGVYRFTVSVNDTGSLSGLKSYVLIVRR
ncbi:MAG: hypothetical protein NVS9B4_01140 [Candidatus Acidiferrum sp.]